MIRYFEVPREGGGAADISSMGLLGDIRAAQTPVVEIDNGPFSLIGAAGVRVPTVATMPDNQMAEHRRARRSALSMQ